MDMIIDVAAKAASVAPGPFLQPCFTTFQIIYSRIEQVRTNKRQMRVVAQTAAQILLALHAKADAKWEEEEWMQKSRSDLERVLERVAELCEQMGRRRFVRSFLDSAADQSAITVVHAQLSLSVDAFQIGSQVSMQNYARDVEAARQEDQAEVNAAMKQLLEGQDALLVLLGESDAIIHPSFNELGRRTDGPIREKTLFGLLEEIRDSLKQSEATTVRDEVLEDVLAHLRKLSTKPPPPTLASNPILVLLKPGLTPDVLIVPLKWKMNKYMWIELLTIHLESEQCVNFRAGEDGSRQFIEYLVSCDDRPLQYAALEVFMQDKDVKHYFKLDFEYTPSDDPNPILANLKPGLIPTVLVPPLRYGIHKWSWKGTLTQHLDSAQVTAFFGSGPDGCHVFINYLVETDDLAIQYAALDVFRADKQVAHYFVPEVKKR